MLAGCERGLAGSQVLHYERSQYQGIYVVERGRRRCLQFARSHSVQSCFDVDHPLALQMPYTRAMMVGLFARPTPTRVLMIGLGGASMVRVLRALDPSMRIDVAELDPAVVRVAESYFGLDRAAGTHVYIEDGRAFVERQQRDGARYDLVLLDAFDADYIPEHLLTVEFLRSVQAILAPGGAVVANTFLGGPLPTREAATYRAVFSNVYQVVAGGNRILLAGASLAPIQQMQDDAQRLEQSLQRFGVAASSLAGRLEAVPHTDAEPFTDRGEPARVRRRRRAATRARRLLLLFLFARTRSAKLRRTFRTAGGTDGRTRRCRDRQRLRRGPNPGRYEQHGCRTHP